MEPSGRPALDVRPLRPDEAGLVVDYFHGASPTDLDRMGVDPARLPARDEWTRRIAGFMSAAPGSVPTFYHAWLVDGRPVGFTTLKELQPGEGAAIHLHLWSPGHRGQGLGASLFCRSVVDAYARFRLRSLVCEPSAANPMPNRMLTKVGFPLERTYVGASSDLSRTTTLNRYAIERGIAQAYLARSA